jgi:hypothetical protein
MLFADKVFNTAAQLSGKQTFKIGKPDFRMNSLRYFDSGIMIPSSFCFPFRSKIHSIYKEIFIL